MELLDLTALLRQNPYPGRGIVLGRSDDGRFAVTVYFIMGRSGNSRNRVFLETEDGIRTEAFDPSKMQDPSLIIYHPVRLLNGRTIVTNGDQTDTVRDALAEGGTFEGALRTRCFEPDGPNFTPRISGLLEPDGSFRMSILKSADGDGSLSHRYFYEYDGCRAGEGRFIHTYMGDGTPLPSFEGEPERVLLHADSAAALADRVWDALNPDNKVSLYVSFTPLGGGSAETVIRNRNQ